jgi:hypothetical protein
MYHCECVPIASEMYSGGASPPKLLQRFECQVVSVRSVQIPCRCPGVGVLTFHLDFKDEKFANQVCELDPNWTCDDF